jgi:hypothetical protein
MSINKNEELNDDNVSIHTKEKHTITVDGEKINFNKPKVTGIEILEKAKKEPIQCFTLYRKLKGCDFDKVSMDEVIDISDRKIEEFITKEAEVFNYTVNRQPELTDKKALTPTEILKLNAIDPNENYLIQLLAGGEEIEYAYRPDTPIKMVCTGMQFESRNWRDIVDIESYGKECKPVPPARVYRIRVDKGYIEHNAPAIAGNDLLRLAGKVPVENFELFKVVSGSPQPQKVKDLTAELDLREKCLVRFVTMPKEQKDGKGTRVVYTLPAEDVEFLENNSLHWEAIVDGSHWVILKDHPVPAGYQVGKVDIALLIPPNYPAAEIDMAYFYPPLQKKSGRPIACTSPQSIDGRVFQRWSRHRNPGEWRAGLDNLSTHMLLVNNWLENDLNK